jgi:hypothetical protein
MGEKVRENVGHYNTPQRLYFFNTVLQASSVQKYLFKKYTYLGGIYNDQE